MTDMDELDAIINDLASEEDVAEAGPADGYDSAEELRALEEIRARPKSSGKKEAPPAAPRVKPIEKWLKDELVSEIERLREFGDTPQRADFIATMPDHKKLKKAELKKLLLSMWKIGLGGADQGPSIDGSSAPPRAPEPETVFVAAKPARNVLDPPRPRKKIDDAALDQIGEQMAGFNLIVVHTIEGVSQQVKPSGYVIEGAAEKLAQPEMFNQVKECMKEIASDVGPEDPVIRTMSNPWFKYAVLMTSVLAGSAKKAEVVPPSEEPSQAGTVRL